MRPEIKESIDRYVKDHCPTGDFLRTVLENDLMNAFGQADEENIRDLFDICGYIYNHAPSTCHGSPEKVKAWLALRGEKKTGIDIRVLTKADVGRYVKYSSFDGQTDKGRIKSWNDKFIFVVYNPDDNWDNFQNYTAAATRPENLEFIEEDQHNS